MASQKTPYDEIPYPNAPFDYTHPRRLEALAALFGMKPPPIPTARVLELGCGDGSNLVPQAECYPAARFVGIDLASTQITNGQATVAALGLTNVELRQGDIMEIDGDWGQFDYIVAHGLFSWVPPEVQDKLFQILHGNLSPHGVTYVSYNTFPGWHPRAALRDLMLFHVAQFEDPRQKIDQARAILEWVAEGAPQASTFRSYLEEELTTLRRKPDGYLYHDYLGRYNQPLYFREFVARGKGAGLQYLGETYFHHMLPVDLPVKVQEVISQLPLEQAEQMMDFVRNRSFRRTLLCHQGVELDRDVGPSDLKRYKFCLAREPQQSEVDLIDPEPMRFRVGSNEITVAVPLLQAVVAELSDAFPAAVGFDVLRERAEQRLAESGVAGERAAADDPDPIVPFLWQLATSGVIEFYLHPGQFVTEVSQSPEVTPLARYQAKLGNYATNRRHSYIRLDSVSRRMILLLDGQRSPESVVRQIVAEVDAGEVAFPADESSTHAADGGQTEQRVEATLKRLAKLALLVA